MNRRRRLAVVAALAAASALLPPLSQAAEAPPTAPDGTFTLTNGLVARTWSLTPFRTERLVDLRTGRVWSEGSNDFTLTVGGRRRAGRLAVVGAAGGDRAGERGAAGHVRPRHRRPDRGGLSRRRRFPQPHGGEGPRGADRVHARRGWPSGLRRSRPTASAPAPTGGSRGTRRATRDWRDDGRKRSRARPRSGCRPTDGSGASAFMVMERNDYASSTMAYDGAVAAARVDLSRDIVYLGPFEEQFHVENPGPGPARSRVVVPPLALESVFTGLAVDADDEPWQHYAYLTRYRNLGYRNTVTFNSDSVDDNRISTGAKDDMDLAEVRRQAAVAKALGVETFILDDGWQASVRRLVPGLARVPGAAPPAVPAPLPRRDVRRRPRRPRPRDGAGAVDEPHVVQPVVRDVPGPPRLVVPPPRRGHGGGQPAHARRRLQRGRHRSVGRGRRRRTSSPASAPRSRSGACATSSSTSSCGWTASARRPSDLYQYRDAFVAHARPADRRLSRCRFPDRRDERLPAVPVRVGRAGPVVVPERRAALAAAAAQPVVVEPVGAGVVDRPAHLRRGRAGDPLDRLPDGGRPRRRTSRSRPT